MEYLGLEQTKGAMTTFFVRFQVHKGKDVLSTPFSCWPTAGAHSVLGKELKPWRVLPFTVSEFTFTPESTLTVRTCGMA